MKTREEFEQECVENQRKLLGERGVQELRVVDLLCDVSSKLNLELPKTIKLFLEVLGIQSSYQNMSAADAMEALMVGYKKQGLRKS